VNDDAAVHMTTLIRLGASKALVQIPFSDNGQVVPVEAAAKEAGIVEAECKEHPWAHAYIASFDHPYFAVTGADGRFSLDSVPPGKYTLKVWHPRGQSVAEQSVEIAASGAAETSVAVKVK